MYFTQDYVLFPGSCNTQVKWGWGCRAALTLNFLVLLLGLSQKTNVEFCLVRSMVGVCVGVWFFFVCFLAAFRRRYRKCQWNSLSTLLTPGQNPPLNTHFCVSLQKRASVQTSAKEQYLGNPPSQCKHALRAPSTDPLCKCYYPSSTQICVCNIQSQRLSISMQNTNKKPRPPHGFYSSFKQFLKWEGRILQHDTVL